MWADLTPHTKELAKLNESIFQFEAINENANELKDRRDQIVREISQKIGLQVTTDTNGRMNIVAPGIGILVNGGESYDLFTQKTAKDGDKPEGAVDIFLKDVMGDKKVTQGIKDGEIAGMLFVRDKVIAPTLQKLDSLAYEFSKSVNEVHEQGVGVDGKSGRKLFVTFEDSTNAARNMDISSDIKQTHEAVAAAVEPGSPGDNRLALSMVDLHSQPRIADLGSFNTKVSSDGDRGKLYTFNESFNSLVGNIGTQVQMQNSAFQHQNSILDQLENYKQTVSGVSLEEEGIGIIQFQNAFNANAKMMKVSDELLQTILTIKT